MTRKNKKSSIVSVEDGYVTKVLAQAISAYLYHLSVESEDAIEKEQNRVRKEKPKESATYDHKDWRWASDTIIYHRGRQDAIDELMEEFHRFMSRCGVEL